MIKPRWEKRRFVKTFKLSTWVTKFFEGEELLFRLDFALRDDSRLGELDSRLGEDGVNSLCKSAIRSLSDARDEVRNEEVFREVAQMAVGGSAGSPVTGVRYGSPSSDARFRNPQKTYEERLIRRLGTLPEGALPEAARQYFVLKLQSIDKKDNLDMDAVDNVLDKWCFQFLAALNDELSGSLMMLVSELHIAAGKNVNSIPDVARNFLEEALGISRDKPVFE